MEKALLVLLFILSGYLALTFVAGDSLKGWFQEPEQSVADSKKYLTPSDAIRLAAEIDNSMPSVSRGTYSFVVKATGVLNKKLYLNSEVEYKDQRNLSVNIATKPFWLLSQKYNAKPKDFFIGKTILVEGEAKRVKIYVGRPPKRSNNFYYQTHIKVTSVDQISIPVIDEVLDTKRKFTWNDSM